MSPFSFYSLPCRFRRGLAASRHGVGSSDRCALEDATVHLAIFSSSIKTAVQTARIANVRPRDTSIVDEYSANSFPKYHPVSANSRHDKRAIVSFFFFPRVSLFSCYREIHFRPSPKYRRSTCAVYSLHAPGAISMQLFLVITPFFFN